MIRGGERMSKKNKIVFITVTTILAIASIAGVVYLIGFRTRTENSILDRKHVKSESIVFRIKRKTSF